MSEHYFELYCSDNKVDLMGAGQCEEKKFGCKHISKPNTYMRSIVTNVRFHGFGNVKIYPIIQLYVQLH